MYKKRKKKKKHYEKFNYALKSVVFEIVSYLKAIIRMEYALVEQD